MTFNEFVTKYEGKTVGYPDGSFVGECLSLVKVYMKETLGFNPPPSGSNSAYGYWSNFPKPLGDYYTKIENTPTGIPKRGDIVIWKPTASNSYGHIAIFDNGDANTFRSFDQNWSGKQAHIQEHNYNNVAGWLRPKGTTMPDTIQVEKAVFEELVTKSTAYDKLVADGYVTKSEYDKKTSELDAERAKNGRLTSELSAEKAAHAKTKEALLACEAQIPSLGGTLNGYTRTYVKDGETITENYKV